MGVGGKHGTVCGWEELVERLAFDPFKRWPCMPRRAPEGEEEKGETMDVSFIFFRGVYH